MRSKSSMYNLIAAMLLQIITLIIGIVLPRVMLLSFGSEINGLVSSIKQFISYITLVEAGLAGACIYSLYKPLADNNYVEINKILSGTKRFYNKSGIVFSILALILSIIFPYVVKIDSVNNLTIFILVLILSINGSLEFFSMGKYRALLTADQKSYVISIIQIVGQILNCITIVLLATNGFNIIIVQLISTSSYIARSVLFSIYVKKNYKYINFNSDSKGVSLHQRWDVLFHQVTGMIVVNSPIAYITFFCSLVEVSIYTVYNMVFTGINGIMSIFNNGLVASFGEILSMKDTIKLQRVYNEYECGYYMIITWIYSCSYILIMPFIDIYTKDITDINYIIDELAICFIIVGILNTLRIPQSTVINAAGHFKETKYKAFLEAIINLISSLIFVKYLGMIGVLFGSICSYAYRTIDFIIYAPKYVTKLPIKNTILRIGKMILAFIIILFPFRTFISIDISSWIEWIKLAIIVSVWSGIIILTINAITDKSSMKSILKRILIVICRKNKTESIRIHNL